MADTLHEGQCSFILLAFVMKRDSVFSEEWVQVAETVKRLKNKTERGHILC